MFAYWSLSVFVTWLALDTNYHLKTKLAQLWWVSSALSFIDFSLNFSTRSLSISTRLISIQATTATIYLTSTWKETIREATREKALWLVDWQEDRQTDEPLKRPRSYQMTSQSRLEAIFVCILRPKFPSTDDHFTHLLSKSVPFSSFHVCLASNSIDKSSWLIYNNSFLQTCCYGNESKILQIYCVLCMFKLIVVVVRVGRKTGELGRSLVDCVNLPSFKSNVFTLCPSHII